MKLRLIHWVAARLPRRDILAEDGRVYLERYRVFGWMPGSSWRGPSLYLHRFRLPDQDTALHNHPWPRAVSLVLAGGYTEERLLGTMSDELGGTGSVIGQRRLRPGHLNIIRERDYHRVSELHGNETWTLFAAWPRTRSWGFWMPGRGHVPWRDRLRERGIDVQEFCDAVRRRDPGATGHATEEDAATVTTDRRR